MNTPAAPQPSVPQHVAIIMDGNGRWAQGRGLARLKGHAAGVEALKRTIENLSHHGVAVGTFYAFSTENWKRPLEEVEGLFTLMRQWFKSELNTIIEKGIRVRFIGNREDGKLSKDILALMAEVESKTAHNTKFTAVFAINYSGRDEILRATQKLTAQNLAPTRENFANVLDTAGLPDPDLMIRTSGEQRTSDFLPWQLAYAEYYFTDVSWPDFGSTHLQAALSSFGSRQRRFGGLPTSTVAA